MILELGVTIVDAEIQATRRIAAAITSPMSRAWRDACRKAFNDLNQMSDNEKVKEPMHGVSHLVDLCSRHERFWDGLVEIEK